MDLKKLSGMVEYFIEAKADYEGFEDSENVSIAANRKRREMARGHYEKAKELLDKFQENINQP